jgi:putative hydroxymethylpyrimidine transport system substrate-binding protein
MVLMAVAALLTGCAEGGEVTEGTSMKCPRKADAEQGGSPPRAERKVFISVNRYVGSESVGILMAQERGYFADVGLAVTVTDAATPNGPLSYVLAEVSDFGVAQQPEVVMAEENGASVIALGNLVSRPTAALIWLRRSKIEQVSDLKGKTIAYSGIAFQKALLQILMEEAGLTLEDVELMDVGHGIVPALVGGRADAAFGGTANVEGVVLEERGLEPVVTPVGDLGIPPYDDLVVITRSDHAAPDARLARDFMSAVARGNEAAVEDPGEDVRLIQKNLEGDPDLTRKGTEASVEATLPLLSRTGCIDLDQKAQLIDWMSEQGLIR